MMQRDDVEFAVEGGVTLRGWLFRPRPSAATSGHHHRYERLLDRLLDEVCQHARPATRGR
jgi:hypothetical protein